MALVIGLGLYYTLRSSHLALAIILGNTGCFSGAGCLLSAMLMVLSSKVSKVRERDRLLDSIPWQGRETVLDVGCGRGLMLIGAAKRLKTGKAVGIDIWRKEDQSDNDPEVARRNAEVEGVADRIEVRDGDARELPFTEGTFDVILSSLALHNIYDETERRRAVKQMVRVVKPGGRVAILDIRHTGQYEQVLRESGMEEVSRSGISLLYYPPVRVVRAVKPFPTENAAS